MCFWFCPFHSFISSSEKKSTHCFSLKNKHRFLSLILVINWCKLSWINLEMNIWLLLWGSNMQKGHWSLFLTFLINSLNSELKSQQSSALAYATHDKTCSYRHKHWLELPQLNVNAYFDFLMLPPNQITFVGKLQDAQLSQWTYFRQLNLVYEPNAPFVEENAGCTMKNKNKGQK